MTENIVLFCEGFSYFRKREKEIQHFYSMGKKKENLILEKGSIYFWITA